MLNLKRHKNSLLAVLSLVLSMAPFCSTWADGGGSVETDFCRFDFAGETVNFTTYTPALSGPTEYCNEVPGLGKTNLVFDLQGTNFSATKLKKLPIEFEVIKGSGEDGERIFHLPVQKHSSGTVNAVVDFGQYGKGDYLVRITADKDGEEVEMHIPLHIGEGESAASTGNIFLVLIAVFGGGYVLYLSNASFKGKVDSLLKKGKEAV